MDLSIIIPVYNTEEYLAECLDSVFNQKLRSFEVIIINDGSTDGSMDIIKAYEKKYSGIIIIIDQENAGLSAARNAGLEIARGKYIYFMDSDDYLFPNSLCVAQDLSERQNLDVLFFSFENICERSLITQYGHMPMVQKRTMLDTEIMEGKELFCQFVNQNEYYVNVWLQFIRKDFIEKHGINFINGIIYEDRLFTYFLLFYAKKVRCLNRVFYCKRIRENSICVSEKGYLYFYSYVVTLMKMYDHIAENCKVTTVFKDISVRIWDEMNIKLDTFLSNMDSITKAGYVEQLSQKEREFFEEHISVM